MNLITIEDIEVAIGRSAIDEAEEAQWLQRIRSLSSFIASYCDDSFEYLENDEVRFRADYYGTINLSMGGGPVISVTSVTDLSGVAVGARFDGAGLLFNLNPNQVVKIVYSHGYATVPEDIKNVCLDVILSATGLSGTGPLKSFTLGDKTEVYSGNSGAEAINVELPRRVLDSYRVTEGTFRIGGTLPVSCFDSSVSIPFS